MVDLEAHCFPPATILNQGWATWGLVSPFLVTLVPSGCSSSATIWVSYRADLGGLAFLLLWVDLWGTWTAGSDTPDQTILSESCLLRPANALVWVWPCPLSGQTGNLQSWKLVLDPFPTSPCSPANKFGGMWVSPTSRLGTGRILYPSARLSVWPLCPPLVSILNKGVHGAQVQDRSPPVVGFWYQNSLL